jgi:L-2-hydroxyglutarate oxidase LhgO
MADSVEIVVVGAGVVGLAVAKCLADAGREVLVLEKEEQIGSETSARNSEVIHAGIYYPPRSMKAVLCVEGKVALYRYCAERGIPHKQCGKLIVAADERETPALEKIRVNATESGVTDLVMIDAKAAQALEPNLQCEVALLSPSTGIIDSHQYMLALEGDISRQGGMVALRSTFRGADPITGGFNLKVDAAGSGVMALECRILINAGGLHAQRVANTIRPMPRELVPQQHFAKGSYFTLSGRAPFERLIYPLPTTASLGLHYSVDLGGQARFGPDVEWVDAIDYEVDANRAAEFVSSIRRYYPALESDALSPGYAGVRPKVVGPGEPAGDFELQGPQTHGVSGLINLFGIESPGLTSSLAIGKNVAALVKAMH